MENTDEIRLLLKSPSDVAARVPRGMKCAGSVSFLQDTSWKRLLKPFQLGGSCRAAFLRRLVGYTSSKINLPSPQQFPPKKRVSKSWRRAVFLIINKTSCHVVSVLKLLMFSQAFSTVCRAEITCRHHFVITCNNEHVLLSWQRIEKGRRWYFALKTVWPR